MLKKLAILLDPETELGGDNTPEDTTGKDPNAGKTMEDFVREQVGIQKEGEEERGDAQKLGETEEEDSERSEQATDEKEVKEEGEEKEETPEEEKERLAKEKSEKDKEEKGETEETTEKTAEEEKPKDPVPYERFEEINTKYRTLEQETERIKPLAEHQQKIIEYCEKNNITSDQFSQVLEIQALLNNNPEEALKRILPIVEAVQGFTGERLPKDLQADVDKGDITLTRARELASLRAKAQFGTNRFDQYQRKQQEDQQAKTQMAMNNAMGSWIEAKSKTNPDFKPRAKDAPKGVYELTTDSFVAMMNEKDAKGNFVNLVKTPQDLTVLLQRAYDETIRAISPARKPKTKPILNSRDGGKSGGKTMRPEDAKTLGEVVRLAAAGRV